MSGGNWWRANEISIGHLTHERDVGDRWRDKTAATDEGIGKASPGGEHLDPDLARARRRNDLLFRQFQDFGTAEPSDTDMLPRHALTVSAIVVGVMLHAAVALTGSLRECRLRRLTRSPSRRGMTPVCAKGTVGVDVKGTLQNHASGRRSSGKTSLWQSSLA